MLAKAERGLPSCPGGWGTAAWCCAVSGKAGAELLLRPEDGAGVWLQGPAFPSAALGELQAPAGGSPAASGCSWGSGGFT